MKKFHSSKTFFGKRRSELGNQIESISVGQCKRMAHLSCQWYAVMQPYFRVDPESVLLIVKHGKDTLHDMGGDDFWQYVDSPFCISHMVPISFEFPKVDKRPMGIPDSTIIKASFKRTQIIYTYNAFYPRGHRKENVLICHKGGLFDFKIKDYCDQDKIFDDQSSFMINFTLGVTSMYLHKGLSLFSDRLQKANRSGKLESCPMVLYDSQIAQMSPQIPEGFYSKNAPMDPLAFQEQSFDKTIELLAQ